MNVNSLTVRFVRPHMRIGLKPLLFLARIQSMDVRGTCGVEWSWIRVGACVAFVTSKHTRSRAVNQYARTPARLRVRSSCYQVAHNKNALVPQAKALCVARVACCSVDNAHVVEQCRPRCFGPRCVVEAHVVMDGSHRDVDPQAIRV